ncbi:lysM domain-containing protein [Cinnamomum micranthum f. kanehirae]|uniref:LysM domain-containing protein n=1 Tax=Cinnamomum micranthum f. kanehirae TaxID=337451 RepID=A0A3S3PGJ9_9MAGN|nr:lysM domain-containing protein [Cinnamomum micranthum f. kanehirae]
MFPHLPPNSPSSLHHQNPLIFFCFSPSPKPPKTLKTPKTLLPMSSSSSPSSFFFFFCFLFFFLLSTFPTLSSSKSTIEPCSVSDSCNAMVGYSLYTDLKVSELATLFQIDPISLLTANAVDVSFPDVENQILPAGLFLKIPILCSCVDGIRKSASLRYTTRASDTLASIADSIFSGLVSADQIGVANAISDPSAIDVGQTLVVPLPCTCFNNSDNSLPAVYLSYVVRPADTVAGIAARYATTVTDLMTVNGMGIPAVKAGDIIAVPLPACSSGFPSFTSDHDLIVANGSYAITAGHCVQCSCGPGNLNLYCTPSSLAASCSSMQCSNSNLMLGSVTSQLTSAGCNVTACSYGGYVNGTILTNLYTSFQPQCPGKHLFPPLMPPPTKLIQEPSFAPAPSQSDGAVTTKPKSLVSGTLTLPGFPPANGPSGSTSNVPLVVNPLSGFLNALFLFLFLRFLL